MKYKVKYTSKFKRDLKTAEKRGYNLNKLFSAVKMIADGNCGQQLIDLFDGHALKGEWTGYRELHIQPDWILIYEIIEDILVLSLSRTGTHSDLFGK